MCKTLFLVVFMAFATTTIVMDKKVVCYYGRWAVYRPGLGKFDVDNIDPKLCTHMVYTFIGISGDGSVNTLDSWADLPSGLDGFGKFTRLRQLSPGTKAMVAVGGWNQGSATFSQVAANPNLRSAFVRNVVNFLRQYNFDGFDVDWEYPNQRGGQLADRQNFVHLLKELREALDSNGYLLSVAVAAAESSASKSYLISQMVQYPHFINLMTYDYNGPWKNFAGANAPIYPAPEETGYQAKLNVDSAVRYWLSQGAPADKIVLGIPFYGRTFTLANPENNGLGAPTVGAGVAGQYTREAGILGYNEICENLRQGGWTVVTNQQLMTPYAFKGNQWVGYDDVNSIREKANYISVLGLAGAMVWSIETDDFYGTCGQKYPLLSTINSVLRGNVPPPEHDPSTAPAEALPNSPLPPPVLSETLCQLEGYIRDPKNCSTFYYCRNMNNYFVQYMFHCPNRLVFDTVKHICNYKQVVPGC